MIKISMPNKFQLRIHARTAGMVSPQKRGRDPLYRRGGDPRPAPFSREEESKILGLLGTEQDQKARSRLIEHNLRLVVYIAKKFDNTGIGVEDLISIGTIGLIKAINTFNPLKNIKLATYASRCIENEILMYLRRNNKVKMEVSIDEPLNVDWDGNELLLSDILGTDENAISKGLEEEVDRKLLRMALDKLGERERTIIELRFGLNTKDGGGADTEGGGRSAWNLAVLYFKAGKKDYEASEKEIMRLEQV